MFTVNDNVLRRYCSKPIEQLAQTLAHELAYEVFGPPLARWLLREEVLEQVAKHDQARGNAEASEFWRSPPPLPTVSGSCWVVFAQDGDDDYPLLRPAMVLPLEWRKNESHSRLLPASLVDIANDVLQKAGAGKFGLHGSAAAGIDQCDLSKWRNVRCDSGWASLFGGLIIAAEGGLPDAGVWASGAWSAERGIVQVGKLDAKLNAARHWNATRFFVPDSQRTGAEDWVRNHGAQIAIGVLREQEPNSENSARKMLQDYLAQLGAPPGRDAPREARKRYYLRQTSVDRRREYYRKYLLEDIAEDCRQQLSEAGDLPGPTHMVTILSDSWELVELAVTIFKPAHVLLLYTRETEKALPGTLKAVADRLPGASVVPKLFEVGKNMISQMKTAIDEFTRDTVPEKVVFDLVPGTKEMTLALSMFLAQCGTRLYYLRHGREGQVVVPFDQTPILRVAGAQRGDER